MDSVEIAIIAVAVAIGVTVIWLVGRAVNRSLAADAVWKLGRPARVRVVSVRETGRALGREERPSPELDVTVELVGSGERRSLKFFVPHEKRELVHEGAEIEARVALDDETRVVIDPALRVL